MLKIVKLQLKLVPAVALVGQLVICMVTSCVGGVVVVEDLACVVVVVVAVAETDRVDELGKVAVEVPLLAVV